MTDSGQNQESSPRIISEAPMRLRWGEWRTPSILLVHVQAAAAYEEFRIDCLAKAQDPASQMPPHFILSGCHHDTALALLRFRQKKDKQEKVTYLSSIMEALINTPCAILRTDLIRRVYQEFEALSASLGLRWYDHTGCFLLPLAEDAAEPKAFAAALRPVDNLQDFFATLKEISFRRHKALSQRYVFYFPRNILL